MLRARYTPEAGFAREDEFAYEALAKGDTNQQLHLKGKVKLNVIAQWRADALPASGNRPRRTLGSCSQLNTSAHHPRPTLLSFQRFAQPSFHRRQPFAQGGFLSFCTRALRRRPDRCRKVAVPVKARHHVPVQVRRHVA